MIREKLNTATPPPIRTGGTVDTDASGTQGDTTATLAVDSRDRGEIRIDGDGFTVRSSGIVTDLAAIGAEHGAAAEAEAAMATIKAIASVYGWNVTLSR